MRCSREAPGVREQRPDEILDAVQIARIHVDHAVEELGKLLSRALQHDDVRLRERRIQRDAALEDACFIAEALEREDEDEERRVGHRLPQLLRQVPSGRGRIGGEAGRLVQGRAGDVGRSGMMTSLACDRPTESRERT